LTIDGGQLERKALVAAAQTHALRALIVLTDCCSSYMNSAVSLDNSRPNTNTVRNLLLKAQGFVSITAADDGREAQTGWVGDNPANAGSCFTVALTRLWYRQNVTFSNWKSFFSTLRQETYQVSSHRHLARAFHLGDPIRQGNAVAEAPLGTNLGNEAVAEDSGDLVDERLAPI
jgi:hypothetical protein